jgi:hypothetical protein
MALMFETTQPQKLLAAFNDAVARGIVTSWRVNARGHITHTSSQWTRQAWFTPTIGSGLLTFYVYSDDATPVSRSAFVFFQTQLLETFMRHFFMFYERASVTPNAAILELAA